MGYNACPPSANNLERVQKGQTSIATQCRHTALVFLGGTGHYCARASGCSQKQPPRRGEWACTLHPVTRRSVTVHATQCSYWCGGGTPVGGGTPGVEHPPSANPSTRSTMKISSHTSISSLLSLQHCNLLLFPHGHLTGQPPPGWLSASNSPWWYLAFIRLGGLAVGSPDLALLATHICLSRVYALFSQRKVFIFKI